MPNNPITYGDINQLLTAEGFERNAVHGPHALFEQKGGRAAIVLPIHPPNAPAAPLHIAMVRHTMLDFAIMSESEFERWVADPKHFQAA